MMNAASNQDESITVVFVYQKTEQTVEMTLNSAQLKALLNSNQVWIERFNTNLKIENTVWFYAGSKVSLQIYLK